MLNIHDDTTTIVGTFDLEMACAPLMWFVVWIQRCGKYIRREIYGRRGRTMRDLGWLGGRWASVYTFWWLWLMTPSDRVPSRPLPPVLLPSNHRLATRPKTQGCRKSSFPRSAWLTDWLCNQPSANSLPWHLILFVSTVVSNWGFNWNNFHSRETCVCNISAIQWKTNWNYCAGCTWLEPKATVLCCWEIQGESNWNSKDSERLSIGFSIELCVSGYFSPFW